MKKKSFEFKDELLRRAIKEQKLCKKWEKDLKNEEIIEQVRQLDADNTNFLKDLVSRKGWPKISQVGEKAAQAAWLILQHSPDKEFMESCLAQMQAMPDEVDPKYLARTIDRVRILNGRLQYYGTHWRENPDGTPEVLPIEDEDHVEERRASMGLPTIEDQTKKYENRS